MLKDFAEFLRAFGEEGDLLLRNGMNEIYVSGEKGDAAVLVASTGPVFEVAFYWMANIGELGTYLMFPPRQQVDFKKRILVTVGDCMIL